MLKKLLLFALSGAAVFIVGILIGHFGIDQKNSSLLPEWVKEASHDVYENLIKNFLAQVDTMQLQESLQVLTRVPHMATTAGDEATVDYMLKRWQDQELGLDAAWRADYRLYPSFTDKDMPNSVPVGEAQHRDLVLTKPQ